SSSRPDLVECAQGFAATHAPEFRPERALAEPAGGYHLYANLFKYHAACYLTHAPIECARAARAELDAAPERIARITLTLDRSCDKVCNIPAPQDGLEAKSSLRQTVAMALAGIDTASLGSYSAATATDPQLVRLRERVSLDFRDNWPQAGAEIAVELDDGRRAQARFDAGVPNPDIADQGRRLAEKFTALATPVVGAARAREVREAIAGLD